MWLDFLLWLLFTLLCGFRGAGGDVWKLLGVVGPSYYYVLVEELVRLGNGGFSSFLRRWFEKIFNRSPITLKFGAEKIRERERQKRERERARARARESKLLYLRSQVVVFCFTLVS